MHFRDGGQPGPFVRRPLLGSVEGFRREGKSVASLLPIQKDATHQMTSGAGLYVHVPFCDKRCDYCDFVTFADRPNLITPYLDALDRELSFHSGTRIETIFIGG